MASSMSRGKRLAHSRDSDSGISCSRRVGWRCLNTRLLSLVACLPFSNSPIYSTVYPAAGSSADWAYDNTTHVKFSFGVELRDTGAEGFLLDASQIVPSGNETLAAVLAMGDYLIANPQSYQLEKQHSASTDTPALAPELKHFGNMKQYAPRSSKQARKHAAKQAAQKQAHSQVKVSEHSPQRSAAMHSRSKRHSNKVTKHAAMAAKAKAKAAANLVSDAKAHVVTPKALKQAKRNLKHTKTTAAAAAAAASASPKKAAAHSPARSMKKQHARRN